MRPGLVSVSMGSAACSPQISVRLIGEFLQYRYRLLESPYIRRVESVAQIVEADLLIPLLTGEEMPYTEGRSWYRCALQIVPVRLPQSTSGICDVLPSPFW